MMGSEPRNRRRESDRRRLHVRLDPSTRNLLDFALFCRPDLDTRAILRLGAERAMNEGRRAALARDAKSASTSPPVSTGS